MKPVKIAMMALTHGHTRKYYQTLRDNSKLDWVASCAADQRAKDVYELYNNGVPCYLSAEEMFAKHPDIEAVVIASANDQHLKEMKLCAERGVHILSMKIPTFDPKEYDEMIELVDKAGIVCQIELEMHYNPVVKRLQEIIASGKLGKLLSIQMTNITLSPVWAFPWQGVPEASYGSRVPLKKGDSRFRGGALSDIEVEDMILASGKMKDGTSFLFDPSWSRLEERLAVPAPGWEIFPKRMEVNVTITGEKGTVMCDCFGPNVYHNGAPNDRYTVQYTYFDEWIGLIDEFVDCIRNHKQPKINLRWHRQTIDCMNACYKSVESGLPANV